MTLAGSSTDSSWADFEAAVPEMAAAARALLYAHGIGLAYVATIRPGGGPRLHPFCPILAVGGLWGFINRGHFAVEYRRTFGELPSETRRSR